MDVPEFATALNFSHAFLALDAAGSHPMSLHMNLGGSKAWWAFLALRSNPALAAHLNAAETAVLFDSATDLARLQRQRSTRTLYAYVLWDGYTTQADLDVLEGTLSASNSLEVLCVGDPNRLQACRYPVWSLFVPGELRFDAPLLFGSDSRRQLAIARLKALSMPFKNLRQQGSATRAGVDLLFGKKRLVFCGSHGLNPKVLYQLSQRHGVNPESLRDFEDDTYTQDVSLEVYASSLNRQGLRLGELYGSGQVDDIFFTSAMHLLFRDYILRRIRAEGLPLYSNGYASGRNINVYTTPFYRQHAFLDFGSVVGDGNYPRRADLLYYRKQVVAVALDAGVQEYMRAAQERRLFARFEAHWEWNRPQILGALRGS